MMALARRRFLMIVGTLGALALVTLYAFVDPRLPFFPKCPFRFISGFDCPGCGSQRALHALLNGDIAGAWGYNAMLIVSLPFLVLLVAAQFMRDAHPRFYNAMNSRAVILTAAVLILSWWILRNIWGI